MTEAGKMAEAGRLKIDAAKKEGSWTMLDAVERLEVPEDMETEFGMCSGGGGNGSSEVEDKGDARRNWEAFPRSVKRGILEWIVQAKRPETRAKRISEAVRMAERNERANQWQSKK